MLNEVNRIPYVSYLSEVMSRPVVIFILLLNDIFFSMSYSQYGRILPFSPLSNLSDSHNFTKSMHELEIWTNFLGESWLTANTFHLMWSLPQVYEWKYQPCDN